MKQSFVYYSDREIIKCLNLNGEGHVLLYGMYKLKQKVDGKCPSAVPLIYILGGGIETELRKRGEGCVCG